MTRPKKNRRLTLLYILILIVLGIAIDYKFSQKLKFSVIDHVVAPGPLSGDTQTQGSGVNTGGEFLQP